MSESGTPAGYRESALGTATMVAREHQHDAIRETLARGTLHQWAATQPNARPFQGRDIAWATALGNGTKVVVRHSRHGGALAALTGDLFLAPTRAPQELLTVLRLREAGVATPEMIAYVVYAAIGPFRRADVATALVDGVDLPRAWTTSPTPSARQPMIDAVAALLKSLAAVGAHHPDLNAKNMLIGTQAGAPRAWVLDVDRVTFGRANDPAIAKKNMMRLGSSLLKLGTAHGLDIREEDWQRLAAQAGVVVSPGKPVPVLR